METLEQISYAQDSGSQSIAKLDRNQRKIKNHLDTINVDGMQKQINVLEDDRGYLTSNTITNGTDLNNVTDNGIFGFNSWASYVNWIDGVILVGSIIVFKEQNGGVRQTVWGSYTNTSIYTRSRLQGGVWSGWKQIPTTERTPFYCTARTGYVVSYQNCYTLNGIAYINVAAKKTDGSAFEATQHGLFNIPYIPIFQQPIQATLINASLTQAIAYNGAIWVDGGCYIMLAAGAAIAQINIHAEVPL